MPYKYQSLAAEILCKTGAFRNRCSSTYGETGCSSS